MAVKKDNTVMVPGTKQGVEVNIYNNAISLNRIHEGSGEVLYQDWAFPQEWKNKQSTPAEKARPVNLYLGSDAKAAIEVLRKLIGIIQVETGGVPENIDNDNIPF